LNLVARTRSVDALAFTGIIVYFIRIMATVTVAFGLTLASCLILNIAWSTNDWRAFTFAFFIIEYDLRRMSITIFSA